MHMKNERENTCTELLYEKDGMLAEFDAIVTASEKYGENGMYRIIMDRTAFFPEGGGQPADTGVIETDDKKTVNITDVRTEEGCVYHYADGFISPGTKVRGRIDAAKRFSRMQEHGAEHLICGLIHRQFGYDNVGFHMSDEGVVFDVDGPLSETDIRAVEEHANRIIFENVPVTVSFPTAEEAKTIEYRSKLDTYENIRLVTIEGYDVCACCAPHVNSTGQIGSVIITSFMPHRGGTRMTLTAGMNAYADHLGLQISNGRIMELLSAKREDTAKAASDLADRYRLLKEENDELKKKVTGIVTRTVLDSLEKGELKKGKAQLIFTNDLDPIGLRELVNSCTKVYDGIVCAFLESGRGYRYIFAVCPENAEEAGLQEFAAAFDRACSGKGGGSRLMVQGTTEAQRDAIEQYFCG